MGFNDRHGQASVEYLVVLAVAVVIAVAAVGVLTGFIKTGTNTQYQKKSRVYWGSADIAIMDWELLPSGQTSTLIIRNNLNYQILLYNVSLQSINTYNEDINQYMVPGDTYKLTSTSISCDSGQTYSYTIEFHYKNVDDGLDGKQFTGVENLVGSCSD
ncbi:MAG: hypothetical protein GF334_08045 [Candidatus Altiarchaeales archaeon]|nr:hypothetical protein [Candidatus Altiarchaeales archaeon]